MRVSPKRQPLAYTITFPLNFFRRSTADVSKCCGRQDVAAVHFFIVQNSIVKQGVTDAVMYAEKRRTRIAIKGRVCFRKPQMRSQNRKSNLRVDAAVRQKDRLCPTAKNETRHHPASSPLWICCPARRQSLFQGVGCNGYVRVRPFLCQSSGDSFYGRRRRWCRSRGRSRGLNRRVGLIIVKLDGVVFRV